jgi:N-acetylglucosamine-6-sulfatase
LPRPRRLLALSALALAFPFGLAGPLSTDDADADTDAAAGRLNVVLIVTDDERADIDRVPSVKRLLAAQGVTFTRFFATTPACCPARAGILTGQYSHHNGVVANSGPSSYPAFNERSNLAVWLHDAGYETALVGKYLNGYAVYGEQRVPPGWSDWQAIVSAPMQRYYNYVLNENGWLVPYGPAPGDYSTTVLTDKAVEFLEDARRPFFLLFAPLAPHLPATPPPDHGTRRPVRPLDRRPSFNESDVRDKPWRSWHPEPLRPRAVRYLSNSIRKRQLASLGALDRSVRTIVATLKRRGLLGRTVIIYASDNGFLWGEHRLGGKFWPYEESIRVPLVVRTPWRSVWGRTDNHLVGNIDLASTIAELTGVAPGLPQDGRSIVPLLRGADPPWRNGLVVEYLGGDLLRQGGPPPYRALRTRRYLYVAYLNGWRELYDLARDPWQLDNVAGAPAYAGVAEELAWRLDVLFHAPPRPAIPIGGRPARPVSR